METKRIKYPEWDDKSAGKFLIQPIDSFTAKGYWWSDRIIFEVESFVFPHGDTVLVMYRWGKPKREQSMGSKVTKSLEDNSICKCKECLAGRKEVKDGWTPWGKHFGFPR